MVGHDSWWAWALVAEVGAAEVGIVGWGSVIVAVAIRWLLVAIVGGVSALTVSFLAFTFLAFMQLAA
jgi:hypothetical protein